MLRVEGSFFEFVRLFGLFFRIDPSPRGVWDPSVWLSLLDEMLVAPWPSPFFVSPQLAVPEIPLDCFSDAFLECV